jgi:hypothetical protein
MSLELLQALPASPADRGYVGPRSNCALNNLLLHFGNRISAGYYYIKLAREGHQSGFRQLQTIQVRHGFLSALKGVELRADLAHVRSRFNNACAYRQEYNTSLSLDKLPEFIGLKLTDCIASDT